MTDSHKGSDDLDNSTELSELLHQWNQQHLLDHFKNEKISVEILKKLKRHHIHDLLKDFKIGDIVLFEHELEIWRTSIGMPLDNVLQQRPSSPRSVDDNLYILNKFSPSCSTPNSHRNSPLAGELSPTSNFSSYISLCDILSANKKGELITKFYSNHKKFQEEQRSLLINIIVRYFDENDLHLSLSTSYKLEKEIVERFPTEKIEFYRIGKRGKIYIKFCNLKRTFKSLATNEDKSEHIFDNKYPRLEPEMDAEGCIKSIKYDNLSAEEFDSTWQACSKYRLNEVLYKCESLRDVFEKWPDFKKPSGFRPIDMDFRAMHPTATDVFLNLNTNFKKIAEFLQGEGRIKDKNIRLILTSISNDNNFEAGNDAIKLLWCIHGYLIPTQKIVTKERDKKVIQKYSVKDSQEAFLYIGETVQQIEEHISFLKSKTEHIQPFILAEGSADFSNFNNFLVYLDGTRFTFTSILRAIDICFKCFHVFNLKYPVAAEYFWSFVEIFFYKLGNSTKKISPKLCLMLDEIGSKLDKSEI